MVRVSCLYCFPHSGEPRSAISAKMRFSRTWGGKAGAEGGAAAFGASLLGAAGVAPGEGSGDRVAGGFGWIFMRLKISRLSWVTVKVGGLGNGTVTVEGPIPIPVAE